jgi:hypothetical protein
MDYRYLAAIAPGGASQVRPRALSLSLAVLAATGGVDGWAAAARAQDAGQAQGAAGVQKGQVIVTTQQLNLRVRRQSDGVEVVIEGVGSAPELQQTTRGSVWLARLLTSRPAALPGGGQRLSVPAAGVWASSRLSASAAPWSATTATRGRTATHWAASASMRRWADRGTCRMTMWATSGDLTPVYPPRSSERQGGPCVDPVLRDARSSAERAQLDALGG